MSVPAPIQAISTRAEALRQQLIEWAEQNSGSSHEAGLGAMQERLASAFGALGAVEAVALPGTAARALRVRLRPAARLQILFSGHYDTVYPPSHDFQRCDEPQPGILRGPGVADMKGGLVVLLAALTAFQETASAAELGGEILLTPDEETGSAASRGLLAEAARRHAFALVFEPARANGNLVRARLGIGHFTFTCHGRAAHAAAGAEAGRNAILALAEYLPLAVAAAARMPGVLLNVGRIRGGTAANTVPDFAAADVNLRVPRAGDAAHLLAALKTAAEPINAREGFALTIEGAFDRPPKEITAADELLFQAWKQCAVSLGSDLGWQDAGGGSDGNLLAAAGLPCLDGLGPIGGDLHSPTEYVRLSSLVSRAQIAALFLHRLAVGQVVLPLAAATGVPPTVVPGVPVVPAAASVPP